MKRKHTAPTQKVLRWRRERRIAKFQRRMARLFRAAQAEMKGQLDDEAFTRFLRGSAQAAIARATFKLNALAGAMAISASAADKAREELAQLEVRMSQVTIDTATGRIVNAR